MYQHLTVFTPTMDSTHPTNIQGFPPAAGLHVPAWVPPCPTCMAMFPLVLITSIPTCMLSHGCHLDPPTWMHSPAPSFHLCPPAFPHTDMSCPPTWMPTPSLSSHLAISLTRTHAHSHSSHSSHPHPPACPHTDMSHPPAWIPTPSCLSHPLPACMPPHGCPLINHVPPCAHRIRAHPHVPAQICLILPHGDLPPLHCHTCHPHILHRCPSSHLPGFPPLKLFLHSCCP